MPASNTEKTGKIKQGRLQLEVTKMGDFLHLLEHYGYAVIFVIVLLDFLGAPITSVPLLLIAGTLAATGRMSPAMIILLAASAAMIGDTIWYGIGRAKGNRVMGLLCRWSQDQRHCVTRNTAVATKYGIASLLLSKFIPGVGSFAPPAADAVRMPWAKFLASASIGSLLWAAGFSGVGYLYGEHLPTLGQLGNRGLFILFGVLILFFSVAMFRTYKSRSRLRRNALPAVLQGS